MISVILPAYNGEKYLGQALESALSQDRSPVEIFVIDNGSTDKTKEVVLSFPEVRYCFLEAANTAAARNCGIALSQGEYLAFLDQDDLWPRSKLRLQAEFLDRYPACGGVIGKQQLYLEAGCPKPHWLKRAFLEAPQSGNLPSALMVRRSVFSATGLFDPSFSLADDVAWFLKAKHRGVWIEELKEVLVHRRIHGENNSNRCLLLQKEILKALGQSLAERRS